MQNTGKSVEEKQNRKPEQSRRQYSKPVEVQRLVAATECERVHALTARLFFTTLMSSSFSLCVYVYVHHQVKACMGSFHIGRNHSRVQHVCFGSNC